MTDVFEWALVQFAAREAHEQGIISADERDLYQSGFIPARLQGVAADV